MRKRVFKKLFILFIFILIILELECSPSVKIGICQFNQVLALTSEFISAPASKELETCSPVDSRTSNSLLSKFSEIFFDKFISIVKNYAIFLIIPMWKDFDLILLIILILLIASFTAALTVIEFKYFTFQFDFNKNDFIVKKGFLNKTKLSVPLNKIQQINLNQNFHF